MKHSKRIPHSQQTTKQQQNTKAYLLRLQRLAQVQLNHIHGKNPVRPFSYATFIQLFVFHADLSNLSLSHIIAILPSHLPGYIVATNLLGQLGLGQSQQNFSLEAYAYYISEERKGKKLDMFALPALYERAIAEAAKRRFAGDLDAEAALRAFWIGYIDTLVSSFPSNLTQQD